MTIDVGVLEQKRDLFVRIALLDDARRLRNELQSWPDEDRALIEKLDGIGIDDWRELVTHFRRTDREFAVILEAAQRARKKLLSSEPESDPFDFSLAISGVSASPYLGLGNGTTYIRLTLETADEKSFVSDQDIEDTLGVGAGILKAAANAVEAMISRFGIAPEHISWGNNFNDRLAMAEESVRTLRQHYTEQ